MFSALQTPFAATILTPVLVGTIFLTGGKVISSVGPEEVRTIVAAQYSLTETDIKSIKSRMSRMDKKLQRIEDDVHEQRVLLVQVLQAIKSDRFIIKESAEDEPII